MADCWTYAVRCLIGKEDLFLFDSPEPPLQLRPRVVRTYFMDQIRFMWLLRRYKLRMYE